MISLVKFCYLIALHSQELRQGSGDGETHRCRWSRSPRVSQETSAPPLVKWQLSCHTEVLAIAAPGTGVEHLVEQVSPGVDVVSTSRACFHEVTGWRRVCKYALADSRLERHRLLSVPTNPGQLVLLGWLCALTRCAEQAADVVGRGKSPERSLMGGAQMRH